MTASEFLTEVARGARFEFGANWEQFESKIDEARVAEAERSLRQALGVDTLRGCTFLDAGSGSGLFSLAAGRLGAARVHSFDYDPRSVATTQTLKQRFTPTAEDWTIEQGSVLDEAYLQRLGKWDIVYSWGVLHHTGDMWRALNNVAELVADGGLLFISIYNDQQWLSHFWRSVKTLYNQRPEYRRGIFALFGIYLALRWLAADLVLHRNPLRRYREYKASRGMSVFHDVVDWLGGYPFEVARPEQVFDACRRLNFDLQHLKTCGGGLGCNEFVFLRAP